MECTSEKIIHQQIQSIYVIETNKKKCKQYCKQNNDYYKLLSTFFDEKDLKTAGIGMKEIVNEEKEIHKPKNIKNEYRDKRRSIYSFNIGTEMVRDIAMTKDKCIKNMSPLKILSHYVLYANSKGIEVNMNTYKNCMNLYENIRSRQCFSINNDFPAEFLKNLSVRILQENKTTELRIQCEQCRKTSLACSLCTFQNSDVSVQETATWNLMMKNIYPVDIGNGQKALEVRHLFKDDPKVLYHPSLSNHKAALQSSMRLWMKLKKSGKLEEFIEVVNKETNLGFQEQIDIDTDKDLPIYYSSINFQLHHSKPIRFVHNHSFAQHKNSSINETSMIPPNVCGNPVSILLKFHTSSYAGTIDLSHAFKSIRTDRVSNNLRRYFFVDKYQKEKSTVTESDMKVFRPTVLSFGSSLSSAYLDLSRIMYVSKMAKLPESQYCLKNCFYVDDAAIVHDSKDKIIEMYNDIKNAFTYYNFKLKEPTLSYQKEKSVEKFLANQWHVGNNGEIDHVRPAIRYSLLPPKRNTISNVVTNENILEVTLTKKVASRLLGLIFSYLHVQLLPLLAGAKILFSLVSQKTQDWNIDIKKVDIELHKIFFKFAKSIINVEERLKLTPRAAIPAGNKLIRIYCSVDSGVHLMCATIHLLSKNEKGEKTCRLVFANNRCHRLTVPKGEISSHRLGVNLLKTFLSSTDLSKHEFDIYLLTDSIASTYIYDPRHIHKCIIAKNAASLVTTFIDTTIGQYKNIKRFSIAWVSGENNPGDKGSKLFQDPIEVANSKILLNGPDEFLYENYPEPKNVFYEMTRGSSNPIYKALIVEDRELIENINSDEIDITNIIPEPKEKATKKKGNKRKSSSKTMNNIKNKNNKNQEKVKKDKDKINNSPQKTVYLTQHNYEKTNFYKYDIGNQCCENCTKSEVEQHLYSTKIEADIPTSSREKLIRRINELNTTNMTSMTKDMYTYLMTRYSSLNKTLRLMGYLHKWLKKYRNKNKNEKSFSMYIKLCKTSQYIHINTNEIKHLTNIKTCISRDGLVCIMSRRMNPKTPKLYRELYLVPYIPCKDSLLIKKLIFNAHHVLSDEPFILQMHRNKVQTKAQFLFGSFPAYISNITHQINNTLKNCLICNKVRIKKYSRPPSALRYFRIIDSTAIHSYSSYDVLGPVYIRPGKKSRGQAQKHFICIILCLKTYYMTAYLMDDQSTDSIRRVIIKLQANYGPVKFLLTDAGACFTGLKNDDEIFGGRHVIIENVLTESQTLNIVEGGIKGLKYLIHSCLQTNMSNSKFPNLTWTKTDLLLNICCSIFNLRCIITQKTGNKQSPHLYLSPFIIKTTYLKDQEQNEGIKQILTNLNEEHDALWNVVTNNEKQKEHIRSQLRHYMFSNAKNFLQSSSKNFEFNFGDFVLLRRGGNEKATKNFKIGQIIALNNAKNFAKVRLLQRTKPEEKTAHISVLVFLHRNQEEHKKLCLEIPEEDRILKNLNEKDFHTKIDEGK